jgi:hypothetical protein
MVGYADTIPYFICQEIYAVCILQHPNDQTGQNTCEQEDANFCDSSRSQIDSVYQVPITQANGSVSTSTFTLTVLQQEPLTASSTSTAANSTVTTTPSSTAVSSSSTPTSTLSSKSGLSSGALAAAIAVPIVAIALLTLGSGFFIYRKRRAIKAYKPKGWEKAELHTEPVPPKELPTQERYELQGDALPGEMAANEQSAHEAGVTSPS